MCDWKVVEADYITGSDGYRKLAAKYGVPESSVRDRMKAGQWHKKRLDRRADDVAKTAQKIVDAVADSKAQLATKVYRIALKMADKLEKEVDRDEPMKALDLKSYSGALMDLYKMIGDTPTDDTDAIQHRVEVYLPERSKGE